MTSNSPKDQEPWTKEDSVGCMVTILLVLFISYLVFVTMFQHFGF